ncbi:MAG: hypothetical protein ACXV5H_12175 [Halobacteriota archaeon]
MKIVEILRNWSMPTEEDVAAVHSMGSTTKGLLLFRFTLGGLIFATSLIFLTLFLFTFDFKYMLLFPLLLVYGGRRFFQLLRFIKAHKRLQTTHIAG